MFEGALIDFISKIMAETGLDYEKTIVKIGLHPELFDRVMIDWHGNSVSFRPSQLSQIRGAGVEIVASMPTKDF